MSTGLEEEALVLIRCCPASGYLVSASGGFQLRLGLGRLRLRRLRLRRLGEGLPGGGGAEHGGGDRDGCDDQAEGDPEGQVVALGQGDRGRAVLREQRA